MEDIFYNKYTQIIPTSKEVVEYFKANGCGQQDALIWFNWQDRKQWKDSTGKKIMEWQKIAWLKINDLKADKKAPVKKDKVLVDNFCNALAEGLGKFYQAQTSKLPHIYTSNMYKYLVGLKAKHKFTDEQFLQFIYSNLDGCTDYEYENVTELLNAVTTA